MQQIAQKAAAYVGGLLDFGTELNYPICLKLKISEHKSMIKNMKITMLNIIYKPIAPLKKFKCCVNHLMYAVSSSSHILVNIKEAFSHYIFTESAV